LVLRQGLPKKGWKEHKKNCVHNPVARWINLAPSPSGSSSTIPDQDWKYGGKGLSLKVDKPFHRLKKGKWLHDRPENDTYKLLIDVFRMKLEDGYKFDGEVELDSIYDGSPSSIRAFQRFFNKVEKKKDMLPPWWNSDKRKNCERMRWTKTRRIGLICHAVLRSRYHRPLWRPCYADATPYVR
jgi:splicing suppressor protein 51